jgi:predicted aspartyl protease
MPHYDMSDFNPPAPVATITLRDLSGSLSVPNVRVLIDSGADVTLIPRRAVERLGIPIIPGQLYEIVSFDGTKSSAQAVSCEVVLLNKAFRGRYLLTDDDCGILGRDVLNHLALVLDGPEQNWIEYLARK